MKRLPVILSCIGAIAFGLLSASAFYSPFAPHYRTVELAPGVFAEQWARDREMWFDIGLGAACALIGAWCAWSAWKRLQG